MYNKYTYLMHNDNTAIFPTKKFNHNYLKVDVEHLKTAYPYGYIRLSLYTEDPAVNITFFICCKFEVYLLLLIAFTAFSQAYVWCPKNFLPDTSWNEKPVPEIGARLEQSAGFWHVCHRSNTHNAHETQNTYVCRLVWWGYA